MNGISLAQALRLSGVSAVFKKPPRLALVGAGGKTTAMFALGRALLAEGYESVFVTTSTHLGLEQAGLADQHCLGVDSLRLPSPPPQGVTLFTRQPTADGRLAGLADVELAQLWELAEKDQVPLLIEADGSRLRPLKAPADHEPAVPGFVDTVVVVAGLSGLGKPLSAEWVHRPHRFAELSGLQEGETVTPQSLVKVLTDPLGGLKRIPAPARRILLLNQADNDPLHAQGREIAELCLGAYQGVIVTALSPGSPPGFLVFEPNGLILLAAGASQRFGSPKQLLEWNGQPLVRHLASLALAAGCGQVGVVVGAHQEMVRRALEGLPVAIIENPAWQAGQATSVRAGIAGLAEEVGAALFLLVDQPFVTADLLRGLFDLHARTLSPLAAPFCQGRRANPVLFDRVTFPALLALQGDTGGRALFAQPDQYPVAWLPWEDERLLLDLDTEEDYRRMLADL